VAVWVCFPLFCIASSQIVTWGSSYSGATNFVVTDLTGVVAISSGAYDALGLENDGTIIASAIYSSHHSPVPAGLSNVVAVAVSPLRGESYGYRLALRSDGTIAPLMSSQNAIGYTKPPPTGLNSVVAISPGLDHALALRSDGTVVGWGYNGYGETNVPVGLNNVVAIAAGYYYSLALRADGKVTAWGGFSTVTNVPASLSNVVAIAAGYSHAIALKADGKVVAWGVNSHGELNVPPSLTNVAAISSGGSYDLALKRNGTMAAWGDNTYHNTTVPSALTNVVAISAGAYSMALVGDGPPRSPAYPMNLILAYGTPLVLPAATDGLRRLSYQWSFNGVVLPSTTNMAFALNTLDFTNSGTYSVTLNSAFGAVTNSYTINVVPLLITIPPRSQSVFGGTTVSFNVAVSGVDLSYQWRLDGTNLPSATNSFLSLTNVLPERAGDYDVVVSNSVGTLISSAATLNVTALGITAQPASQTVYGNANVAFGIGTAGVQPISYQWRFNGTNLPGETNSSLSLQNVLPHQAGIYSVMVSNVYTTLVSDDAALNIVAVGITSQPQNQSVLAGTTATFDADAAGVPPIYFWWRMNGTNLPGEPNRTLIITNVQLNQAGTYSMLASNAYSTAESYDAVLTVSPAWFTTQPLGLTTFKGGSANLSVNATSNIPFQYHWMQDGTPIPYATNNLLALTNLQFGQAGLYSAVVNNAYGTTSSDPAVLSVVNFVLWNGWTYPVFPSVVTNVSAIAAGWSHFIVLNPNGTICIWGSNGNGQLNVPPSLTNVIAVAANSIHSIVLRNDGTVATWGHFGAYGLDIVPPAMTNTVAVAAGGFHNLGLRADGVVVGWGLGQDTLPVITNAVAIAGGHYHSLALRDDGTVIAWPGAVPWFEDYGQANVPSGLTNVVAIAAGEFHSLALKANGKVVTWGSNGSSVSSVPLGLSNVVSIAAGNSQSFALKTDGTIVEWGEPAGIPLGLTNVSVIISAGGIVGDSIPIVRALITNPSLTNDGFTCSIPSDSGRVYRLEYKNSLSDSEWSALPLLAGNGGILVLTDSTTTNSQRFYRVRRW
jgi:alpha-tubulin suppressor-like RCC1 family protein